MLTRCVSVWHLNRSDLVALTKPTLKSCLTTQEAICHEGSKATRAIYLRNGLVFTTGFSKMSERQYSLRAPNHLNDPIVMVELDTSNGVMFPLYDADTNMVYLCGKVSGVAV